MKRKSYNKNPLTDLTGRDFTLLKYITLTGRLGLLMVAGILICFFLFRWLIILCGINIKFQFIGILLGIILGIYNSYRLLKRTLQEPDNEQ